MKVFKFYADWCQPCKALSKNIEGANIDAELVEINIDEDIGRAAKFGVRGIPLLVLVDDNGNEIRRKSGLISKDQFEQFVNGK